MIQSLQHIRGRAVEATDGLIGHVEDIYFDDHKWIVRYYVVDTGKWMPGRKVLIPPHETRHAAGPNEGFPVNLTREQVQKSPDIDTDRPVSRRAELVLYRHYGWTPYWFPLDPANSFIEGDAAEREREATTGHYGGDPNLRSAREVTGYRVSATDDDIGHVDDFLIDDLTSKVRYVVIDTRNWLPGKHVLIAPEWIRDVKWSESRVFVKVTRQAVADSPEYNSAEPLSKEYESRLSTHYGYPLELL
jgi:uncharacterized protein YrrD